MISLISIVVFIMAVYLMNKMFIGFQPGSNRINSDVGKFREKAQGYGGELVPWNNEELELFSFNQTNQVAKRGFGRSYEGVVQSIYHEPMLYYSYKEYPATNKNAIVFARTAQYELVYRIRAKGTQIFVNEDFYGTLTTDGSLRRNGGKKVLGSIHRNHPQFKEIILGEKILGRVVIPTEKPVISPRAFDLDEKMDQDEQLFFMVLGIYEVIMHLSSR